jgi:hypothetical protein
MIKGTRTLKRGDRRRRRRVGRINRGVGMAANPFGAHQLGGREWVAGLHISPGLLLMRQPIPDGKRCASSLRRRFYDLVADCHFAFHHITTNRHPVRRSGIAACVAMKRSRIDVNKFLTSPLSHLRRSAVRNASASMPFPLWG